MTDKPAAPDVDRILMLVDEYGQSPAPSREATERYSRLREAIKQMDRQLKVAEFDRDLLLTTFRHFHVNAQDGTDQCAECGLDLRNEVHLRSHPRGYVPRWRGSKEPE